MTEGLAANPGWNYERWEGAFGRLMGIEGKVLDEELVGRSVRNIDFFTRFKKDHPDQLVLLHFNGNARLPSYHADRFFAGHWLYYNGTKVLCDLSADESESVIKVENPNLFMVKIGRFKSSNEDLGICLLDNDGRPDWSRSEQLQLISVDQVGRTVRVRRGCFGTRPRSFLAGRSYLAAHACEGPWQVGGRLLWAYNYATTCPKDSSGKTCGDVLVEELAGLFLPGGRLEAFDGLEFDVLMHTCLPQKDRISGRHVDCDADGKPDNGIVGGVVGDVNVYGIGVVEFCRQLRGRLQERQLLLADGGFIFSQRACGIINGIESEGWPEMRDYHIRDWSGGLNRLMFWKENSRPPVFNYINHKFSAGGDMPGSTKLDLPFSTHRLVLAVAQCADAGLCYIAAPAAEPNGNPGIWDELIKGRDKQVGWLGQPLGDVIRLATKTPDLLAGKGKSMDRGFMAKISGKSARCELEGRELRITGTSSDSGSLHFSLKGIPVRGGDLFIQINMRGECMKGYPPEIARLTWVTLGESAKAQPRNAKASKLNPRKFMTWTNGKRFTSGFYFSNVKGGSADVTFEIEGTEPVWISDVSVHACPDVICREFEHGVVLANPAPHPFAVRMGELFGDKRFRRIMATAGQDAQTNNGTAVEDTVTLAEKDGLFLTRENASASQPARATPE